jgi:hypothetical protein
MIVRIWTPMISIAGDGSRQSARGTGRYPQGALGTPLSVDDSLAWYVA